MAALVVAMILIVVPVLAYVGLLIWASIRDGRDQARRDRLHPR
jgi:hypothetical protein